MKVSMAAARKNAGLTQPEVCKAIGVGVNTLCDWEKGRKYPRIDQLEKFCEVCGCTVQDISFA